MFVNIYREDKNKEKKERKRIYGLCIYSRRFQCFVFCFESKSYGNNNKKRDGS